MTTRKKLLAAAEAANVRVEIDHDLLDYHLTTDVGRVFECGGHWRCFNPPGPGPWASKIYDDMLRTINEGLYPCENPDCDTCNEEVSK